jgi:hypothetical protein
MKLVVLAAAKAELRRSRQWYERRQQGLGSDLLDDVLAALTSIERNPDVRRAISGNFVQILPNHKIPFRFVLP